MKRVAVISCVLAVTALFTCGPNETDSQREARWTAPAPPGGETFDEERLQMVQTQIGPESGHTYPVRDKRVLKAMETVPRHLFVPGSLIEFAYDDNPLPIGFDQTISQPYMVAKMTELLNLNPDSHVLEIGAGSGYQAAVLAEITPHVYTIEIIKELGKRTQKVLDDLGYDSIHLKIGDGYKGWPKYAPFDGIIVTCA
ncbi:MAG: protein-L-isoaspartate O-methyltransferase family protein, partial [Planctomycetota bacterium]